MANNQVPLLCSPAYLYMRIIRYSVVLKCVNRNKCRVLLGTIFGNKISFFLFLMVLDVRTYYLKYAKHVGTSVTTRVYSAVCVQYQIVFVFFNSKRKFEFFFIPLIAARCPLTVARRKPPIINRTAKKTSLESTQTIITACSSRIKSRQEVWVSFFKRFFLSIFFFTYNKAHIKRNIMIRVRINGLLPTKK